VLGLTSVVLAGSMTLSYIVVAGYKLVDRTSAEVIVAVILLSAVVIVVAQRAGKRRVAKLGLEEVAPQKDEIAL